MGKTIETRVAPKQGRWPQKVDGREQERDCILVWCRENLRGRMWWTGTKMRDDRRPRTYHAVHTKRNFSDTYEHLTFWFEFKTDAAKFVMMFKHW